MKDLLPKSSTILFFTILLFLLFSFISYRLLVKNLSDDHLKNQEITFYQIQKDTNNLLTKLLYKFSIQKEVLLAKHKEVLTYLHDKSYDIPLDEIYKKINENTSDSEYNIYITDENLIIKNTTFPADLNFDLSFAKELFENHYKTNTIGISPPIFEMYSLKFFSYTDSYLSKKDNKVLQVSYTFNQLNDDLKKLQHVIDSNPKIKASNAYILFNDGYIGDFIFKSLKSYKPTLKDIEERIKKGEELSNEIKENEYKTAYLEKENNKYKVTYFSQKSPIFDEAKIVYSIVFDESEYNNNLIKLNLAMIFICFIGIITIYIIYKVRFKENLLTYKDKFIEHSVHEIKTPLAIISLNIQLRNKFFGQDKYSKKIEGALKTLENSYEDMTFLHTKEKINYHIEHISLQKILKDRIKYFEIIASTQNRKLDLEIINNIYIDTSKIELHRLIDNNLSNAIKYSKIESTIKIILKDNVLEFQSFGKKIIDVNKIFDKYTRENNSSGGHGLGLSIVNDICKKYNIDVRVTSMENGLNIFSYKFNCHNIDI
ncbi:MAG: HAMP domain-containing histidine kinase [Aliarcobacter sp.]|nr:HAMP domain-containing histidine kinase [Aliarcobacter sp.]